MMIVGQGWPSLPLSRYSYMWLPFSQLSVPLFQLSSFQSPAVPVSYALVAYPLVVLLAVLGLSLFFHPALGSDGVGL